MCDNSDKQGKVLNSHCFDDVLSMCIFIWTCLLWGRFIYVHLAFSTFLLTS